MTSFICIPQDEWKVSLRPGDVFPGSINRSFNLGLSFVHVLPRRRLSPLYIKLVHVYHLHHSILLPSTKPHFTSSFLPLRLSFHLPLVSFLAFKNSTLSLLLESPDESEVFHQQIQLLRPSFVCMHRLNTCLLCSLHTLPNLQTHPCTF